jgi:hypothetical protein
MRCDVLNSMPGQLGESVHEINGVTTFILCDLKYSALKL